jgi:uncharacterized repeat protein (TIGR03806 family)
MRAKIIIVLFLFATLSIIACRQSIDRESSETTTTDVAAAKALLQEQSNAKASDLGNKKLSEYGFFSGALKELKPVKGVIPYDLNTPLFSDYAHKSRFFKLPEGTSVAYREKEVLDFPVGTYIIKNFYYFHDDPDSYRDQGKKGKKIIETRLLLREPDGWKTLPSYIWNDEQTEAFLTVEGGTKNVSWINEAGKKMELAYSIPSQTLCKSCHVRNNRLTPIGPKVRQLNRSFAFESGTKNQLAHYAALGILTDLPPMSDIPKTPVWNDPASGSLHRRALAYLDINCAHCHNPDGPGNTSALHLSEFETNEFNLGINKNPVAAGKGTGGRPYDIVKGEPDQSILVYRMESTNPGEMMPEVARKLVHREGIALIKEWIRKM